jgi:PIN domain nuclease of toxin-antitoxin system
VGALKLLLDTHALLWSLLEPEKLSGRARAALEDPDQILFVSSASAWEIGIKHKLGRLTGAEAVVVDFQGSLERLRAESLEISVEHALGAASLPSHHRDPFDRMLVSQARAEGATLVTKDPAFKRYEVPLLW